jgi:hypothetical protein
MPGGDLAIGSVLLFSIGYLLCAKRLKNDFAAHAAALCSRISLARVVKRKHGFHEGSQGARFKVVGRNITFVRLPSTTHILTKFAPGLITSTARKWTMPSPYSVAFG